MGVVCDSKGDMGELVCAGLATVVPEGRVGGRYLLRVDSFSVSLESLFREHS